MRRRTFFRGLLGLLVAPFAALGLGGAKRGPRPGTTGPYLIHTPPNAAACSTGGTWTRVYKRKRDVIPEPPCMWYENDDGDRHLIDFTKDVPPPYEMPEGATTCHARFPNTLVHRIYLRQAIGGPIELGHGESTFSDDLATAMVRSGGYTVQHAVAVAAVACEGCGNVLAHEFGLPWGYRRGSEEHRRCRTHCELCKPPKVVNAPPDEVVAVAVDIGFPHGWIRRGGDA